MKGPFERLKYDLRRLWECPYCKRRERTDGSVTTRFCNCPGKEADGRRKPMMLVEEAGHRTTPEFKYSPAVSSPANEIPEEVLPPPSELPLPAENAPDPDTTDEPFAGT